MRIFADHALLADGWHTNVTVTISSSRIIGVETRAESRPGDYHVRALLPALSNLHSHTFQRGMSGMTETRGASRDSFWTWREVMYRFIDRLTPEQIEAIAAMAFVEMQQSGFAAVAEFHYVHHQPGGTHYDSLSELSERIFLAAAATGIGLTHLPVLYAFGGAGNKPLAGGQLRFGSDADGYEALHAAICSTAKSMPDDTVVGFAPHSLRAVNPPMLKALVAQHANGPIHIHIAEQVREVEDIQSWLGARPVDWLLDAVAVDSRWCLIHATHMSDAETSSMAKSGAVAGLCPVTEANLGDGIFQGRRFLESGGALGVGTDSNVRISLPQELSMLEYSQRLKEQERNVLIGAPGSTGDGIYRLAAVGGAQALGRDSGAIETGRLADLTALDTNHPALCALMPEQYLDGWIFGAPDGVVTDVWSAGRHKVKDGRHVSLEAVTAAYRSTMRQLASLL